MRPLRTSPEYRQTAAVMARATVTAPEKGARPTAADDLSEAPGYGRDRDGRG